MVDYKLIGVKIRQARKEKGLTQEKLSEKCGLSNKYFGVVEGGFKKLSVETLIKIANALDVSVDYLLSDSLKISDEPSLRELVPEINSLNKKDHDMIIAVIKAMLSCVHKNK